MCFDSVCIVSECERDRVCVCASLLLSVYVSYSIQRECLLSAASVWEIFSIETNERESGRDSTQAPLSSPSNPHLLAPIPLSQHIKALS